jgi:hypothetical protein
MNTEPQLEATVDSTATTEIPVRYEVAGKVIDIEKTNRIARRMLNSQATKFRKKFAHLRDYRDEQGRGVTIVIRQPKAGVPSIQCIVEYPEALTDSVEGSEKAVRIA